MRIEILDRAEDDLIEGFRFYENQQVGIGSHFLVNLYLDIDSLSLNGGIHPRVYKDYHRLLSRRFRLPFTTRFRRTRCSFTPSWTVDEAQLGFGNN